MEFALALLVLIAIVILFVVAPLRRDDQAVEDAEADRRAELDFRMGKVSEADHRATDRELRAQAIEILERLDALDDRAPAER